MYEKFGDLKAKQQWKGEEVRNILWASGHLPEDRTLETRQSEFCAAIAELVNAIGTSDKIGVLLRVLYLFEVSKQFSLSELIRELEEVSGQNTAVEKKLGALRLALPHSLHAYFRIFKEHFNHLGGLGDPYFAPESPSSQILPAKDKAKLQKKTSQLLDSSAKPKKAPKPFPAMSKIMPKSGSKVTLASGSVKKKMESHRSVKTLEKPPSLTFQPQVRKDSDEENADDQASLLPRVSLDEMAAEALLDTDKVSAVSIQVDLNGKRDQLRVESLCRADERVEEFIRKHQLDEKARIYLMDAVLREFEGEDTEESSLTVERI